VKPERADVEKLNSWSDRQFGDWIRGSLYDYHIGKRGRFAFEPFHTFFGEDYNIVEEVMSLFGLLGEHAKGRFKSGLSIALAETELLEEQVFDAILDLARRTAATHLLRIFPNKLLKEWQSQTSSNREIDHSIVWTVGVLARFAGESALTAESVSCLEVMARSERMPKEYVFPLFSLLFETRPDEPVANLDAFWYLLDIHFGDGSEQTKNGADARKRLIEGVYQASGRDGLLKTIVPRVRRPDSQYAYSWWQEASVRFLLERKIPLPQYDAVEPRVPYEPREPQLVEETDLDEAPPWLVHFRRNVDETFAIAIASQASRAERTSEW
jgi:hypothetical protein